MGAPGGLPGRIGFDPNVLEEFQQVNGEAADLDDAAQQDSRKKHETDVGSIEASMLELGVPGSDPSLLTLADREVIVADLARKYFQTQVA